MCFDSKEDSCLVSFLTFMPGIICCLPCIRAYIYSKKVNDAESEHGIKISEDGVRFFNERCGLVSGVVLWRGSKNCHGGAAEG